MGKFDKLKGAGNAPVGALDLVNDEKKTEIIVSTSSSDGKKKRRSFMLTDEQIRMLNKAKVNHPNVNTTLSDIVGAAIEEYCR